MKVKGFGPHNPAIARKCIHPREYKSWECMKRRCTNLQSHNYYLYGGRGVLVCKEWYFSFSQFYKDMGSRPPGKTLNRKNNDLGYFAENCEWADKTTQANNRRDNIIITHEGETLSALEWSSRTGIKVDTIRSRHRKGWSPFRILDPQDFRGQI